MLGCCLLPEGEVVRVVLVALAIELAGVGDDVVEVAARETTIVVVLVVLLDIEVDRAVRLVGISRLEDALNHLNLLDDVARGVGLDRGRLNAKLAHSIVVALGVVVRNLHRLELLEACLLSNLIFALVGILLEVAHIGDVTHIAHLVAQRLEIAEHKVEGYGGAGMTQVWVAIDGRTADIHAYMLGVDRLKHLLAACERIVQGNLFHLCVCFFVVNFRFVSLSC